MRRLRYLERADHSRPTCARVGRGTTELLWHVVAARLDRIGQPAGRFAKRKASPGDRAGFSVWNKRICAKADPRHHFLFCFSLFLVLSPLPFSGTATTGAAASSSSAFGVITATITGFRVPCLTALMPSGSFRSLACRLWFLTRPLRSIVPLGSSHARLQPHFGSHVRHAAILASAPGDAHHFHHGGFAPFRWPRPDFRQKESGRNLTSSNDARRIHLRHIADTCPL